MNINEELNAYIDGELTPLQAQEIERAATESGEIRDELEALRALKVEFSSLASTPEPTGKQSMMAKLRPSMPFGFRMRKLAIAGTAAATLLVAAAIMPEFARHDQVEMAALPRSNSMSSKASMPRPSAAGSAEAASSSPSVQDEDRNVASKEAKRVRAGATPDDADAMAPRNERSPATAAPTIPQNYGRDIIYNGSMSLEVPDVQRAVNESTALIQGLGGFIVSSETSVDSAGRATAYLDLRVPVTKFDTATKTLTKYGTVLSQNTSGQDVTAEIAAGEGRARSLAQSEQQYITMLNSTRDTTARLEIRRRLDEVRSEREVIKEQTKRMKDLAALSTLSVQFQGVKVLRPEETTDNWWSDSNTGAANALGAIGRVVGRVVIYSLYLSPVWLTALAVWWFARRRKV